MKSITYLPMLLGLLFISCNTEEEPNKELNCLPSNNKVSMTRFVKSEKKSNHVNIDYQYNDLNLLKFRKRSSPSYVFETEYIYDCSNNIIEIHTDEIADPQRGGSDHYYTYDENQRLIAYADSFQESFDYRLTYNANIVTIEGTIWSNKKVLLELVLNEQGRVIRLDRISAKTLYNDIKYSVFQYDTVGNLISIEDFNDTNQSINKMLIRYDDKMNPYLDQLQSVYLESFINLFYHAGYWGSDIISREGLIFPYNKNNIESVSIVNCTDCYPEITKRIIKYDELTFPENIVESYFGAPAIEIELQYYEPIF